MQQEALVGYRLSPQQRRLWTTPGGGPSTSYETKCAAAVKGHLENSHFKTAVQNVVARHEILRTTFRSLPGMTIPIQFIGETGGVLWQEDDISGLDQQASIITAYFQAASHAFDLEQGPLLHLHLIKLAPDDYAMIVRTPAICADSVGLRNLVGEICRSYSATALRKELNVEVAQYADLAEWQNELLEAEDTRFGREYWQKLHYPPPFTQKLAFEGNPSSEATFTPCFEELQIAPSLMAKLESLAQSAETSLERILLSCWYILLWRQIGQSDVEIGIAFDGRCDVETQNALGLFAKYLPIICHLEEGLSFRALVGQVDKSLLAACEWQEFFSWEWIIKSGDSAPGAPSFPFCFESETAHQDFLAGDVSFTIFKQYACINRFKLKLSCRWNPDGCVAEFHYDSELFRPADIRYLIGRFSALLESSTAAPFASIGELEMISKAECRQLLDEYNSTKFEWPGEQFVQQLFLEQANRTPEAIAVIYEEEQLTYHELNERADKLASYLRELGVGPEVIVGLCMDRSLEFIVSMLATLKAGGAYLPLDPSNPTERLAFILEDADAGLLVTQTRLRSRLPEVKHVVFVDDLWETISQTLPQNRQTMLSPDNLAYVIYTSGSTGRPKGVMLRHRSLRNYLLWAISHYRLEVGCGAPVHSSLSFDLMITALFTPLLVGGYVHLLSTENEIESLSSALREGRGYSLVKLTPGRLQLLGELLEPVDLKSAAHSFVVGGENLSAETVNWWREADVARFFNEYGPTESVVGCSVYDVGSEKDIEEGRAIIPIGRPISNTTLYILDERQRLIPQGVVGELFIGGEGLARGYLNRPDQTAEKFLPNPYSTEIGARLYRTGDLARYLRNGQIDCLGRIDQQVKVRGYRVELGEIESVLREIPGVREAAVLAREDNHGDKRLIAYYTMAQTAETESPITAEELRARLSAALPGYMAPAAFVMMKTMPLTPNGKLDRQALPDLRKGRGEGESALSNPRPIREENYVAPRDFFELQLVWIWERVLGIQPIGVRDNFFDLGGHSLLAVRLIAEIRKTLGRGLAVQSLFQAAEIERLAAILRREADSLSWSCLVELQSSGSQPPLFFVHPGGGNGTCYLELARFLGTDRPFYGFQSPGLYGEALLYTKIEDMAAHYVDALKAIQPEGPYFLGGWSLGGIVAYEMAQQLVMQGQRVSQLLLLDSDAFPSSESEIGEDLDDAALMISLFGDLLPISMADLEPFEGDGRIAYVLKRAKSANLLPPDVEIDQARTFTKVFRTNARARLKYVPQAYPGALTLFKTQKEFTLSPSDRSARSERMRKLMLDPTMGWGELAAGGVQIVAAPGHHETMVAKPHVETLALLIKDCLNGTETG